MVAVSGQNFISVIDGIGGERKRASDPKDAANILALELRSNPLSVVDAVASARKKLSESGNEGGACFVTARITESNSRKMLEVWQQGDCAVVVLAANGKIKFESEDDSMVELLVSIGKITKDQAMFDFRRNIVLSAVKKEKVESPKTYPPLELESGDRVIVMSDGAKNLTSEDIAKNFKRTADTKEAFNRTIGLIRGRMQNAKEIIASSDREKNGQYSDGYKPAPKPDNLSFAVVDIV